MERAYHKRHYQLIKICFSIYVDFKNYYLSKICRKLSLYEIRIDFKRNLHMSSNHTVRHLMLL